MPPVGEAGLQALLQSRIASRGSLGADAALAVLGPARVRASSTLHAHRRQIARLWVQRDHGDRGAEDRDREDYTQKEA
jgi:hypothetical protein